MSRRSRVLHIITSLAVGGAQRHLLQLLPGLGAPDSLDLIYFRDHHLREAVVPLVGRVRHLPMAGLAGPALVPVLAGVIESGSYDLVHTHLLRADIYGATAARMGGVRWVVSTKHNVERRLDSPWWAQVHRTTAQLADRTICISDAVRRWAVRVAGVPPATARVIRYGIDPTPFQDADPQAARWALGLGPEDRVALCPARLDPQKNHGVLLRAFAGVTRDVPNAKLLLAGGRQLGSQAYVDGLVRLADDLGLEEHVRWLGVRRDMAGLLAAADVVTLASDWEGFGLALLEAMAAGRPVVATRVGGVPEVVADGRTGRLVPPRDCTALQRALDGLLRDPDRARAMGAAGAARARDEFGLERMQRETCAVYAELLGRAPG